MVNPTVNVTGADATARRLSALAADIGDIDTQPAAVVLRNAVERATPVDTGRLKSDTSTRPDNRRGRRRVVQGANTRYAIPVHARHGRYWYQLADDKRRQMIAAVQREVNAIIRRHRV